MENVSIHTEDIQLDQFLKIAGAIMTGGEVKGMIAEQMILKNGEIETARRRKLHEDDVITILFEDGKQEYKVVRED